MRQRNIKQGGLILSSDGRLAAAIHLIIMAVISIDHLIRPTTEWRCLWLLCGGGRGDPPLLRLFYRNVTDRFPPSSILDLWRQFVNGGEVSRDDDGSM